MSRKAKQKSAAKPRRHQPPFIPSLYITRELTQQDVIQIKQAFDSYDSSGQGLLSPNDLKQALFNINFYPSKDTVYDLMAECDVQGVGGLTFDSFIRVIGSHPEETESVADLKKLFKKYDKENKGYITESDLIAVARQLQEGMTEEECIKVWRSLDQKGRGKIQFEQFCQFMHHPRSLQ